MNRLTEALKRAGNGAIELPASTATATADELFPAEQHEQPAPSVVPHAAGEPSSNGDAPVREALADGHGSDDTRMRVRPRADGERVTERRESGRRPRETSLAVFSGFNKTLLDRLVVPEGAPSVMTE